MSLPDFLQQQLQPKAGNIIEIPRIFAVVKSPQNHSRSIPKHAIKPLMEKSWGPTRARIFYDWSTQRAGRWRNPRAPICDRYRCSRKCGLCWARQRSPRFVTPRPSGKSSDVHWVREDLKTIQGEPMEMMARIRYRQPLQKATLIPQADAFFMCCLINPNPPYLRPFVAWYLDKELLGSGVIA